MNQEFYHKFLVIVPEEQHIIKDCPEITQYIYKFIVSKPCEKLIEEIEEITSKKTIFWHSHQGKFGSVPVSPRCKGSYFSAGI